MSNLFRRAVQSLVIASFVLGALAQTVTIKPVMPASDPTLAGVETGPYSVSINSAPALIISDDFYDATSSEPSSWTATELNVTTLLTEKSPSTAVKFDTKTMRQQQDYKTVAYLAEELVGVNQSTVQGQTTAGLLNFAIWSVFDSNALSKLNLGQQLAVDLDVISATALSALAPAQEFANVNIFTSTVKGAPEVLTVQTPEPSSIALLAFDLTAVAALIFYVRRRTLQNRRLR